jgi:phage terminase small subunit
MSDLPAKPTSRAAVARKRDQRLRRFRRQLLVVAPNLDDSRFAPLIAAFGRATLLAGDAYEFLREHGLVNADGELRASVDVVQRLFTTQLKLARELGLTPAALGKLRNEKPVDLAAAFAENDDKDAE